MPRARVWRAGSVKSLPTAPNSTPKDVAAQAMPNATPVARWKPIGSCDRPVKKSPAEQRSAPAQMPQSGPERSVNEPTSGVPKPQTSDWIAVARENISREPPLTSSEMLVMKSPKDMRSPKDKAPMSPAQTSAK